MYTKCLHNRNNSTKPTIKSAQVKHLPKMYMYIKGLIRLVHTRDKWNWNVDFLDQNRRDEKVKLVTTPRKASAVFEWGPNYMIHCPWVHSSPVKQIRTGCSWLKLRFSGIWRPIWTVTVACGEIQIKASLYAIFPTCLVEQQEQHKDKSSIVAMPWCHIWLHSENWHHDIMVTLWDFPKSLLFYKTDLGNS